MKARRYVIVVILVVLGVAMGLAPTYFRKPLTPSGAVGRGIEQTLAAVRAEDWGRASALAARLETDWKRVKVPIAVNSDATAVRDFETQLATLRAAIELRDKNAAVTALALMTTLVEDLGTY
ncbi:hypothetical protein Tmar_1658 [Thermaerobacter marianensis DSM 12885]|uniref:DUF4363 domain-containing protein n=1 Tax=Thermaerobacter marianensis (strain ATCC 700841 / DSM 12885 / JCM 10246 / 7p75a) TaxID=644966 RepID=E6SHA3_THEM7|nr:DUF4363 family protein [Thermaerobacter marianensis]ADU51767.1 hypothetical protein Tmar_1658 [Thermaerobacter marianensis DSM 12885]